MSKSNAGSEIDAAGKVYVAWQDCRFRRAASPMPTGSFAFDQAIYVPTGAASAATSSFVNTSSGEHPVPGAASDHATPTSPIRNR